MLTIDTFHFSGFPFHFSLFIASWLKKRAEQRVIGICLCPRSCIDGTTLSVRARIAYQGQANNAGYAVGNNVNHYFRDNAGYLPIRTLTSVFGRRGGRVCGILREVNIVFRKREIKNHCIQVREHTRFLFLVTVMPQSLQRLQQLILLDSRRWLRRKLKQSSGVRLIVRTLESSV